MKGRDKLIHSRNRRSEAKEKKRTRMFGITRKAAKMPERGRRGRSGQEGHEDKLDWKRTEMGKEEGGRGGREGREDGARRCTSLGCVGQP